MRNLQLFSDFCYPPETTGPGRLLLRIGDKCQHRLMKWLADYLAKAALRILGLYGMLWATLIAAVSGLFWVVGWHRGRVKEGKPGVQNWHLLLAGLAGTWLFLSLTIGSAAYWIYSNQKSAVAAGEDGPLVWGRNFSLEGGMGGLNVFSIRINGANISKQPVSLKQARLVSLIDGTPLDLEIVAVDTGGEQKIVALDKIQMIAPGAPIELVAKFGPADPSNPDKILGLDPKAFLERWRQFTFSAADEERSYSFDVKEDAMMPFFKGRVGPRVAIKPST